jgi:hypothetical protein
MTNSFCTCHASPCEIPSKAEALDPNHHVRVLADRLCLSAPNDIFDPLPEGQFLCLERTNEAMKPSRAPHQVLSPNRPLHFVHDDWKFGM